MTRNGITTTINPGTENFSRFFNGGRAYCQYDYRALDGDLFSTVKPTLQECRDARDNWLADKADFEEMTGDSDYHLNCHICGRPMLKDQMIEMIDAGETVYLCSVECSNKLEDR